MPSSSRNTQSNGISGMTSTWCLIPLTVSSIMPVSLRDVVSLIRVSRPIRQSTVSRRTGPTLSVCLIKRLDKRFTDRVIGPWILASDELTINDHVGLEIDLACDHVAARCAKSLRHVEVHLSVQDFFFDPLLFGSGKNRHLIAGILPTLGQLLRIRVVTGHQSRAKFGRTWHRGDERYRTMTEQR